MPPDLTPATAAPHAPAAQGRRSIATMPAWLRELGRIRLGHRVPGPGGKPRPAALDRFRLTSPSPRLIAAAAAAFGGTPQPWQPPDGPAQHEVIIDLDELDVLVPPTHALSQAFELWSAGGCQRRCDGVLEQLSGRGCMCPTDPERRTALAADGEACVATTRLSVMLPQLPDLGVWRIEAHGFYAAVELAGAGAILDLATANNRLTPARVRIDRRQIKRPGEPRRDFVVPVLELLEPLAAVLERAGAPTLPGPVPTAAALAAPPPDSATAPALPPAPDPDPDDPPQTGSQAARARALIRAAGLPAGHLEAFLTSRYRGATRLDDLSAAQLAALADRIAAPGGVEALKTAAAEDHAASPAACRACGERNVPLDGDELCEGCSVPF